ncbi:P-loop containing nucleoside triphosphate hydrolase protein [Dacryopinax primogenitus]|uniref:p-loop containing nucleoside triphosphate hydrolase protein n=1 Tax=Dacryopinax primogenitus (strain DJM 731) TaxID=1858805 RepID=M5G5G5_DACPD|nr:P-loop containing nucleoside triphosphate hydrolase protein [Dacryopinax primogenitus]EJU03470.1 P-loop containing nucleoside triphosphate hydrolase protein [Dacryopinax primogenitus]
MTPHSPPISEFPNKQIVLVLCGLIGSGKSTFALFLSSHFPTFIRCNQDDLGTRTAVYQLAESSLRQGLSVCIDRCNFDPEQRRVWTELARKWGVSVWALGLNTSQEVCADRLLHRPPHPTVPPHHALSILARFAHQYTPPTYAEDFDRILCLADGARGYAREDMESLLRHIGEQVRPCARAQVLPKQEQGEGEQQQEEEEEAEENHPTVPGILTSLTRPAPSRTPTPTAPILGPIPTRALHPPDLALLNTDPGNPTPSQRSRGRRVRKGLN